MGGKWTCKVGIMFFFCLLASLCLYSRAFSYPPSLPPLCLPPSLFGFSNSFFFFSPLFSLLLLLSLCVRLVLGPSSTLRVPPSLPPARPPTPSRSHPYLPTSHDLILSLISHSVAFPPCLPSPPLPSLPPLARPSLPASLHLPFPPCLPSPPLPSLPPPPSLSLAVAGC